MAPPEHASRIRVPSAVQSQTPSPRSTLGCSTSRNRWKTLLRSERIAPTTAPGSATRALLRQPRHPVEVPLYQPPEEAPALLRPLPGLHQQRIRVDAFGVQLVAVRADPLVHDLGGDLGVELQAQAPPGHERLRAGVAVGDQR